MKTEFYTLCLSFQFANHISCKLCVVGSMVVGLTLKSLNFNFVCCEFSMSLWKHYLLLRWSALATYQWNTNLWKCRRLCEMVWNKPRNLNVNWILTLNFHRIINFMRSFLEIYVHWKSSLHNIQRKTNAYEIQGTPKDWFDDGEGFGVGGFNCLYCTVLWREYQFELTLADIECQS